MKYCLKWKCSQCKFLRGKSTECYGCVRNSSFQITEREFCDSKLSGVKEKKG